MNIFLIGYRCSGKSAVGKALSKKMGLAFVDMDRCLAEKEGRSIAEMVAGEGWEYFRARETEIISALCLRDGQVVATGGGIVLNPGNVAAMKSCGRLVWLRAEPETIRGRMLQDCQTARQRPSLTSRGSINEIESTLIARMPAYQAAMDFSIDTDRRSLEDVCEMIAERLNFNINLKE